MLISLTDQEAELLRRTMEIELEELGRERHHTKDREFRDYLHQKEHLLVDILAKLGYEPHNVDFGTSN